MGAASDIEDDFVPSDTEEPRRSDTPAPGAPSPNWEEPMTPNHGRRGRERSPESSPVSDTRQRKLRRFVEEACDRNGVGPAGRADAIARSKLSTHNLLMLTFIEGLAPKAVGSEPIVDFAKTRAFKENIAPRLHATLLDANIHFYVKGLTLAFVKHIRLNYASYGLRRDDLADFQLIKSCTSAVSNAFTTHRNELKTKLSVSIETKQDIGSLVKQIVMDNYEVTKEHWFRYAILRDYLVDFQKLCREGTYNTTQFWHFIDAKLLKFRENVKKFPPAERSKRLQKRLDKSLAADQKAYPFVPDPEGLVGRPATVVNARFADIPDWQLACQDALVAMQAYAANEAAEAEATAARVATAAAEAAALVGEVAAPGAGGGAAAVV